jgi:hypothetical protein
VITNTLAISAALAKRPQHDHDFKFVARTGAELCAHIASEIAAARCGPAPDPFDPGDDDELVEPSVPAPRRQRKRSLASTLRAARKAGADGVIVDGVVIALSPAAAAPAESETVSDSSANEWDAVLPGGDHGPH